jgi:hypothetical protein
MVSCRVGRVTGHRADLQDRGDAGVVGNIGKNRFAACGHRRVELRAGREDKFGNRPIGGRGAIEIGQAGGRSDVQQAMPAQYFAGERLMAAQIVGCIEAAACFVRIECRNPDHRCRTFDLHPEVPARRLKASDDFVQ